MSIIEENHKAMRSWSKLKGENSWTMFKVIAELVDGFDRLNTIGPCVSLFGSARTQPDEFYYKMAIEIAHLLTDEGFGVIKGGGDGGTFGVELFFKNRFYIKCYLLSHDLYLTFKRLHGSLPGACFL